MSEIIQSSQVTHQQGKSQHHDAGLVGTWHPGLVDTMWGGLSCGFPLRPLETASGSLFESLIALLLGFRFKSSSTSFVSCRTPPPFFLFFLAFLSFLLKENPFFLN